MQQLEANTASANPLLAQGAEQEQQVSALATLVLELHHSSAKKDREAVVLERLAAVVQQAWGSCYHLALVHLAVARCLLQLSRFEDAHQYYEMLLSDNHEPYKLVQASSLLGAAECVLSLDRDDSHSIAIEQIKQCITLAHEATTEGFDYTCDRQHDESSSAVQNIESPCTLAPETILHAAHVFTLISFTDSILQILVSSISLKQG